MPLPLLPRLSLRSCGATLAAGALLAAGSVPSARAGSFSLSDQSPSAVGLSFAGSAAMAEDPSGIFFNPASMGFLDGFQTESSYTYISSRRPTSPTKGSQLQSPPPGGGRSSAAATAAAARAGRASATRTCRPRCFDSERYGKFNLGIAASPCPSVRRSTTTRTGSAATSRCTRSLRTASTTDCRLRTATSSSASAAASTRSIPARCSPTRWTSACSATSRGIPGFAPGSADGSVRVWKART